MARSVQRRFDIQILKDKPGAEPIQVAAAEAVVNLYRQGATVRQTVLVPPIPDRYPVAVFDRGDIRLGDTVLVGLGGPDYEILAAPDHGQVYLSSTSLTPLLIEAGTRLIPFNSRPIFKEHDPFALGSGPPSPVFANADGRVSGYVAPRRFDYFVSGAGLLATRSYVDVMGGSTPSTTWLNARDFPSIQDAIKALPASRGGVVFIPPGTYELTAPIVIQTPSVTLRGAGPTATILKNATNPATDMISVNAVNPEESAAGGAPLGLFDLQLDGASKAASCLVFNGGQVSAGRNASGFLRNLIITRAGATHFGLRMEEAITTILEDVRFISNSGGGARLRLGTTTIRFIACSFVSNSEQGVQLDNAGPITFMGCRFVDNAGTLPVQGSAVDARNGSIVEIIGCVFRKPSTLAITPEQFIYTNAARAPRIVGCWFDGGPASSRLARAVRIEDTPNAEFAGNTAMNMSAGMIDFIASPTGSSHDAIESCNRDLDFPDEPRIGIGAGVRVCSLSRGCLSLDSWPNTPGTDRGLSEGALVWVEGAPALRVLRRVGSGFEWKEIAIS